MDNECELDLPDLTEIQVPDGPKSNTSAVNLQNLDNRLKYYYEIYSVNIEYLIYLTHTRY